MFEVKDVGNKHYQNDGTNCEHLEWNYHIKQKSRNFKWHERKIFKNQTNVYVRIRITKQQKNEHILDNLNVTYFLIKPHYTKPD